MTATNIIDMNFDSKSLSNNRKDILLLLLNLIIPLYVLITTSISLYYFSMGDSKLKIKEFPYYLYKSSNSKEVESRSICIYYILLASIGCIIMSLRLLINSNWIINLTGIILIFGFRLFLNNKEGKLERYYKDDHNKFKKFKTTNNNDFSVFDSIKLNYTTHLNIITIKPNKDTKENIQKLINNIQENTVFSTILFCYRFELINIIITIICTLLSISTIVSFIKSKWKFNLKSINLITILVVFIINIVYLAINATAKNPIRLNITREDQLKNIPQKSEPPEELKKPKPINDSKIKPPEKFEMQKPDESNFIDNEAYEKAVYIYNKAVKKYIAAHKKYQKEILIEAGLPPKLQEYLEKDQEHIIFNQYSGDSYSGEDEDLRKIIDQYIADTKAYEEEMTNYINTLLFEDAIRFLIDNNIAITIE